MKSRAWLLAALLLFPRPTHAAPDEERVEADRRALEDDLFGASDAPAGEEDDERSRAEVPVLEGEVEDREAALFGSAPPAEPLPPERAAPPGDEVLEDREGSLGRITERLGELQDPLQIGGALWLWGQYQALSEGAPKTFRLSSPSFLDLYLDTRPNDRVRGFVQGRLTHDFTVGRGDTDPFGNELVPTRVFLDQLWIKLDLERVLFITAGKQRIRWGAGRFWNPTDFVNPEVLDPLAFLDLRLGVSMIKLHLPVEALGWNFYAIAKVEGASRPDEVGGALRGEFVIGQTELTVSAAVQKDQPLRLGADVSTGIGLFDLRAEVAVRRGVKSAFFRGDLRFEPDLILPERYFREDEWIPQVVAGAEVQLPYSAEDSIILGVEYFFNDAGVSNERLYPAIIRETGGLNFLYTGRHYLGAYAVLMRPGRWENTTIFANGIVNLSDMSALTRLDWSVRVLTFLDVRAFAAVHLGTGALRPGFDIPPLPDLPNGLRVVPPAFSVGGALVLGF